MKRTERDEFIDDRIEKNIKLAETQSNVSQLKVPMPSFSSALMDTIIRDIEELVIDTFSKNSEHDILSLRVCDSTAQVVEGKIFGKILPFVTWLRACTTLAEQNSADEGYQRFAYEWRKQEIVAFLKRIAEVWNDSHAMYIMTWKQYDLFRLFVMKKKKVSSDLERSN